jgi:hypothetical protein
MPDAQLQCFQNAILSREHKCTYGGRAAGVNIGTLMWLTTECGTSRDRTAVTRENDHASFECMQETHEAEGNIFATFHARSGTPVTRIHPEDSSRKSILNHFSGFALPAETARYANRGAMIGREG